MTDSKPIHQMTEAEAFEALQLAKKAKGEDETRRDAGIRARADRVREIEEIDGEIATLDDKISAHAARVQSLVQRVHDAPSQPDEEWQDLEGDGSGETLPEAVVVQGGGSFAREDDYQKPEAPVSDLPDGGKSGQAEECDQQTPRYCSNYGRTCYTPKHCRDVHDGCSFTPDGEPKGIQDSPETFSDLEE